MNKNPFKELVKSKDYIFQNFYFYYIFILTLFLLIFIYYAFSFRYTTIARDFKFKREDITNLQESYIRYGSNLLITYMDNFYDIYPNLDTESLNKRALKDFRYKTKDYKNKFIFFKKDGTIVYKSSSSIKLKKNDLNYILNSKKPNIQYKDYSLYLIKDATLYKWNLVILSDPDFLNREFGYVNKILKNHSSSTFKVSIVVILFSLLLIILSTILLRNMLRKYFIKYERLIEDRKYTEQNIRIKNLENYLDLKNIIKLNQSSLYAFIAVSFEIDDKKRNFSQLVMSKFLKDFINRVFEFDENVFFSRSVNDNLNLVYIYMNSSSIDEISSFVKKIQNIFLKPFNINGENSFVKSSIVVSLSNIHGDTLENLIFNSSNEIRELKNLENSSYKFITNNDSLSKLNIESEYIVNKILYGLENDEFDFIFQKVDYKDDDEYFETYLNWNSPDLGVINRVDLDNLISRTGMNYEVLSRYCDMLFSYYSKKKFDFNIIININAIDLLYVDLYTLFTTCLDKHNIDNCKLILDLDSSILSSSLLEAIDNINKLASKFRVSLDNYMEISNIFFKYLSNINIDAVKFSKDVVGREELKEGINKLIEFFALYDIKVGIKNINSEDDYNIIKDMNFNILEGEYLQKSITKKELEKYYRDKIKK